MIGWLAGQMCFHIPTSVNNTELNIQNIVNINWCYNVQNKSFNFNMVAQTVPNNTKEIFNEDLSDLYFSLSPTLLLLYVVRYIQTWFAS